MKKALLLLTFIAINLCLFSQDYFYFSKYDSINQAITANKNYPEVVFMGNSITENWGYYHPDFFKNNNFACRGISGQTSAQMLVRFRADVVDIHPKAVVIMAGTNDVAHNELFVTPEHVVENIISMCEIAKSNKIIPIISSIPPCSGFPWRKEIEHSGETILLINKILKDYAKANKIIYVDYHSLLSDDNFGLPKELSKDGCHPNKNTYCTMEKLVTDSIKKALRKNKTEYFISPEE